MRTLRIVLWALVLVAGAILAIFLLTPRPDSSSQGNAIELAGFGGPFTLVGADGKAFSSSRLNGRPHALFFGFTHCPDVCPTTLARLVRLREQLGKGASTFDVVFVTVDPERDGPAEVGKYAELFGSPVIGLTGSPAQIAQVKKQFGIYSRKVPDSSGNYSVDHTATVLLFGRDGKFVATISPDEPDSAALAKLKRISA